MADDAKRSPEPLASLIESCRDYRALLLDLEYDEQQSRLHARWAIGQIWHSLRARNIDPIPVEPDHDSLDRERALKAIDDVLRWVEVRAEQTAQCGAMLSAADLAQKHNVNAELLRKRLVRWTANHDEGYTTAESRRKGDPTYLFEESAVMPVIESLKSRKKTSAIRPTRKKSRG